MSSKSELKIAYSLHSCKKNDFWLILWLLRFDAEFDTNIYPSNPCRSMKPIIHFSPDRPPDQKYLNLSTSSILTSDVDQDPDPEV